MITDKRNKGIRSSRITWRTSAIKINRLYFMVDLTTFDVKLYQNLAVLRKSITAALRVPIKDLTLYRIKQQHKVIIFDHRYVIGRCDNIWLNVVKKDVEYINSLMDHLTSSPTIDPDLIL